MDDERAAEHAIRASALDEVGSGGPVSDRNRHAVLASCQLTLMQDGDLSALDRP